MKIWCLANEQPAHIEPVEAALKGEAQFIYDRACDPDLLVREKPDLVLCVNDYPYGISKCLDAARAHGIPSLAMQDGILEWRCQYENPLFGAGGGAPQHQPVLADKIACIGRQSARQIARWNSPATVEVTGMPRLDHLQERTIAPAKKPGASILVMTAKNPGFTPEQRKITIQSLVDVKKHLETVNVGVLWRVSKVVAVELGVENQLQQISSLELVSVLCRADAVISTMSTAVLETMLTGRPVAALDYHNVPRFVPTAWTISASGQIGGVVNELLNPPPAKMAFQQDCLADCLKLGKASERMARLIRLMADFAKSAGKPGLVYPVDMIGDGALLPAKNETPLSALYTGQNVFREQSIESMQARLARAENENSRLKAEIAEVRNSRQLGSVLRRIPGLLRGGKK